MKYFVPCDTGPSCKVTMDSKNNVRTQGIESFESLQKPADSKSQGLKNNERTQGVILRKACISFMVAFTVVSSGDCAIKLHRHVSTRQR